jgi:hypothetical protein
MVTVEQVKTRIEAIAALMSGMVTTQLNSIGTLNANQLYALDVKPETAAQSWATLRDVAVQRDYRLYLFVRKVRDSATDDAAMQEAMDFAYTVADALPLHFKNRQKLELVGNDPLVYWTEPMRAERPAIVSYGNANMGLFAVVPYTLTVKTRE